MFIAVVGLVNSDSVVCSAAKHGFKTIDFVHIYSLSPAPLKVRSIHLSVSLFVVGLISIITGRRTDM